MIQDINVSPRALDTEGDYQNSTIYRGSYMIAHNFVMYAMLLWTS